LATTEFWKNVLRVLEKSWNFYNQESGNPVYSGILCYYVHLLNVCFVRFREAGSIGLIVL